ncbi:MAG: hypothetical protein AAF664_12490 [Planctomycetota bacterium]
MLFFLGGASRTGKSWIAKQILQRNSIACLSLDWLVMGFTNGMPQCGIHDKLMPHEIGNRMTPFIEKMCESMIWVGDECVIEGESVLPALTRRLSEKHPEQIRACFLGYADANVRKKADEIQALSTGDHDWLTNESSQFILEHVENMIDFSSMLRSECDLHQQSYVETSGDFLAAQATAMEVLEA